MGKPEPETNPAPGETNPSTSDNRYRAAPDRMSSSGAARWLGVSQQWVVRLSKIHKIGQLIGNYWNYSPTDIILLGKLLRHGRKPMRNAMPPVDPELILRQLKGQDELKSYMAAAWRQLHSDLRSFIGDVSQGLFNSLAKARTQFDRDLYVREQNITSMLARHRLETASAIGVMAQEVADLRRRVEELSRKRAKRKRKSRWARGVRSRQELAPPVAA